MAHLFAVIMAGGVGSRFWPRSRERSPKQLLDLTGSGTMIQNTVARIQPLVPAVNTLVVTNSLQYEEIVRQLPFIPKENILVEPVGRNTAPCVGLAATWINRVDPNGVMIVLPADHIIQNVPEFLRILSLAVSVADETNGLVTIGIKPTHPETGYGYIQFSDEGSQDRYKSQGVYPVKTFAEKPNLETAERFLRSGDFLWNSGMFVWKASAILSGISTHLPDLAEQLQLVGAAMGTNGYPAALEQAYGMIRGISIDYGVMEKAGNVYVVKGEFGWNDVGSWDEAARLATPDGDGNVKRGVVITRNARNNFIQSNSRVIAAIGVEDLIIVSTEDAVLICKKGQSQDVKEIVDYMRRKQMNEYL